VKISLKYGEELNNDSCLKIKNRIKRGMAGEAKLEFEIKKKV